MLGTLYDLCMLYFEYIACGAFNGSISLLVLYGTTPDISTMLLYTFYQPVFYATHDQHFYLKVKNELQIGQDLVNIVEMQ